MTLKHHLKDDGVKKVNKKNDYLHKWDSSYWVYLRIGDVIIVAVLLVLIGIGAGVIISNL